MAGITAHRSRRELGYEGLAQRTGARTPEQFVQQVTGVSRREAGTLVRVGELMDAATATPGSAAGRSGGCALLSDAVAARRRFRRVQPT